MNLIKIFAGSSLLVLLLAGCTGLSELPTSWGNNASSPDVKATGYNPDTKTGWMSYNDSTHLYFAFSFFDPRVQARILLSGMTVFIDQTGKMKEDCFVRFPLIKREVITEVQAGQKLQPKQGAGRAQRSGTDMLLDQAEGFELQWKNGTDTYQVNPSLEKTDFKTSVGLDSTNALNMVIGVPLNKIQPGGLASLDEVVIGLRFGQIPEPSNQGGGARPQMSGSQQPVLSGSSAGAGGGGGGRGGRGGGGGGGSRGGSGGGSGGAQMSRGGGPQGYDNSPVEFWYKTKIAKR